MGVQELVVVLIALAAAGYLIRVADRKSVV